MLSTERPEFDAELEILFGGFPAFLTQPRKEAYWKGLQKMPLQMFRRCVEEALGENGQKELPTTHKLWALSKQLRAAGVPRPEPERLQPVVTCKLMQHANTVLVAYLSRFAAHDAQELARLVAEKNRLVEAYVIICKEEPNACSELLGVLTKEFNRLTGNDVQPEAVRRAQRELTEATP